MLPFIMARRPAGSIMATVKEEGGVKDHGKEEEINPELLSHAEDAIRAIHSKDAHALTIALQAHHECCNSLFDSTEEPEETPEE